MPLGLENLDDIATATFNAIHVSRSPAYDPIDGWADLEEDDFDEPKREWKLIREALEWMPDEVFLALCKLKGM